jgi:hypothetical protein
VKVKEIDTVADLVLACDHALPKYAPDLAQAQSTKEKARAVRAAVKGLSQELVNARGAVAAPDGAGACWQTTQARHRGRARPERGGCRACARCAARLRRPEQHRPVGHRAGCAGG